LIKECPQIFSERLKTIFDFWKIRKNDNKKKRYKKNAENV